MRMMVCSRFSSTKSKLVAISLEPHSPFYSEVTSSYLYIFYIKFTHLFLVKVMAVLTLKGSQKAEQFVTDNKALKAINPINLAAKTDAIKNKPADTYSNIRGNGIKDED
ncbi:hypothetical protein D8674_019861 [Pyrus ussuriensis x Pyrus communis]|uniref:Uncharacterized protein n=1 Tax=Pyrus ussuriensis x Pyrus communis TaxID=2448454 RepID=A0A5N5G8R5_9ROSA|nr:hypothetical protein D8674_019861 [Pyrus ussuriensis x Pyrus communis]